MQQRIDAARRMFAEKVAMFTGLSVDAVTGTEAAVFEGQSGIEAGLADELINASASISVMATALSRYVQGENKPERQATGNHEEGNNSDTNQKGKAGEEKEGEGGGGGG
ncbi:S49 family peptidase, partial [Escherichia coli]|uniref:S49 family peptidase n=1 Tax=Escherichia coli TaxID=562 RepID=UPI00202549D9